MTNLITSVRETDGQTGGRYHDEADELVSDMQAILVELRLIDVDGRDVLRGLKLIYNNKVLPMRKAVDRWQEKARKPESDDVISVREGTA